MEREEIKLNEFYKPMNSVRKIQILFWKQSKHQFEEVSVTLAAFNFLPLCLSSILSQATSNFQINSIQITFSVSTCWQVNIAGGSHQSLNIGNAKDVWSPLIWYLSSANPFCPLSPKRLSSQHSHAVSSSLLLTLQTDDLAFSFAKLRLSHGGLSISTHTPIKPTYAQLFSLPVYNQILHLCSVWIHLLFLPMAFLLLITTFPFNHFFIPGFMVSDYIVSIYISYSKVAY